ncbi:kinase-like domain-containing protein [Dactylonectria macrodidyma]|uniref:non-specific serine/threonine protein kinase n=1 Tax=Dactylonectria macrodidyma TaxID=307937 RepID=A0A9P9ERV4_9HYPO|nr:kinase-like domain-containing protein [Dactylonectria macrodidyma]
MFFSQEKLRQHFGNPSQIKRLLACECSYCKRSRERFSELDTKSLTSTSGGPLFLALLVYLSKLHFVYPWMVSKFRNKDFPYAASFLHKTEELQSYFETAEKKALFDDACRQAVEMFDPVILDFSAEPVPEYKNYERMDRFPFCDVQDLERGSFGRLRRFEIYQEYCRDEIRDHMKKYPGSISSRGSDRKLLFASKSVHKSLGDDTRTESDILRMVARIKKPEAQHIVTLLTCYSWQDHIYFVFPYIESDLYILLNESKIRHELPKVSTTQPLPKHWLWEQMVGVSHGLSTIHTGMENPFEDVEGQVIACHFDLKPANILITADKKLKITDFGRSYIRLVGEGDQVESSYNSGDMKYAPPESQLHEKPACDLAKGKESVDTEVRRRHDDITALLNYDIWSLACIMTEVLLYVFDRPDRQLDNQPDQATPLEEFHKDIQNTPMTNRFFNQGSSLKSCVKTAIDGFQQRFREEAAHHRYITDVAQLLLGMFDGDRHERLSSDEVVKRLESASATYETLLRTQGDPLASKVLGYTVPNDWAELGWVNDSGSIMSFAEMGDVRIEAVDRATTITCYRDQPCRFRLFKRPAHRLPAQRSFLLVWAREGVETVDFQESETGAKPFHLGQTDRILVTFPAWCFQPTYLFQENKSDCMLFRADERFEGLAYIFTFRRSRDGEAHFLFTETQALTKPDLYNFQGTFLEKRVLHDDE